MTIIFFYLSLFVMVGLVASKIFEIKVRKINFLANIFGRGDRRINQATDTAVYKYNRYKKITQIFIFEFLPTLIYEFLVKMKNYVSRKYYEAGQGVRGQKA